MINIKKRMTKKESSIFIKEIYKRTMNVFEEMDVDKEIIRRFFYVMSDMGELNDFAISVNVGNYIDEKGVMKEIDYIYDKKYIEFKKSFNSMMKQRGYPRWQKK